jgi:dethiobiotin synthetase
MFAGFRSASPCRIIFVTGTDTGVGKTLLTGLLLHHLRSGGWRAAAIKPFCCGGRADAKVLSALQEGELSLAEVNPFYFRQPIAPLVAARRAGRTIPLPEVINHIQHVRQRLEHPEVRTTLTREKSAGKVKPGPSSCGCCLLIEGCGGLLAPLGEGYTAVDLIAKLDCEVIVVAANRLGTINHALLTLEVLRNAGIENIKFVLMNLRRRDVSCASNVRILSELLAPVPLLSLPYLGSRCGAASAIKSHAAALRRPLARI